MHAHLTSPATPEPISQEIVGGGIFMVLEYTICIKTALSMCELKLQKYLSCMIQRRVWRENTVSMKNYLLF